MPQPGSFTDQRTFSVLLQRVGSFLPSATPSAFGPRQHAGHPLPRALLQRRPREAARGLHQHLGPRRVAAEQVIASQQWMTVQEEDKQNRELLDLSNQILNLTKAIHARTGVHPDAK